MTSDRDAILAGTELLVRSGRYELAVAEFERFVHEQPGAWPMAAMLADLFRRAGETAATEGRSAEAIAYFGLVAKWRSARGDRLGADELRARIEILELDDVEAQLEVARTVEHNERPGAPLTPSSLRNMRAAAALARDAVARGNAVDAANHLTPEMAQDDPATLLTIAEVLLRGGQLDRGIAIADRAMSADRTLAAAVARLGVEVAEREPNAGLLLIEMADVIRLQDEADSAAKSA
jgi:tetratricopeptide (TPR) repeat protein